MTSFSWDQWNVQKNEVKHGVSALEAESVFFDEQYLLFKDLKHSTYREERFVIIGKSNLSRILMIAFTVRKTQIRIITARPASKKERRIYEKNQT